MVRELSLSCNDQSDIDSDSTNTETIDSKFLLCALQTGKAISYPDRRQYVYIVWYRTCSCLAVTDYCLTADKALHFVKVGGVKAVFTGKGRFKELEF